jgi:hypothetical protein
MRKIEREMLSAILAGKDWQHGNTCVSHDPVVGGEECEVRLHGHLIAKRYLNGQWEISLAGWNTVTTRSRLSTLIRGLAETRTYWKHFSAVYPDGLGVSSRKGIVRLHDARGFTTIDSTGWHRVIL